MKLIKTVKSNLNKLTGVDKAYYIVSLFAATAIFITALLFALNLMK